MQGPDNGNIMLFDEAEQHGEIDVSIMHIMQMDQVRLEFLHLFQRFPCGKNGKTAVKPRNDPQINIQLTEKTVADIVNIVVGGKLPKLRCHHEKVKTFPLCIVMNFTHDLPGRTEHSEIDRHNLHFLHPFGTIYYKHV